MNLKFWKNGIRHSTSIESAKGSIKNQVIAAIFMNFAQLAQGTALAWMSPMSVFLQRPDSPTGSAMFPDLVFWAVSSISLGGFMAMPVAGFISQKYGRKPAAIFTCIPMAISWILVELYLNERTLIISRVLAGMTCGASFLSCVVYISETADPGCRGALGSMLMLMNSVGVLLGYLAGGYLHYKVAAPIFLIFSLIHTLAFMVLPETPEFLVKLGKIEDAKKSLTYFKSLPINHKIIEEEITKLKEAHEAKKNTQKPTFLELFQDSTNRRSFLIVIILTSILVFNGGFAITNYVSTIFDASLKTPNGKGNLSMTLSSSIIGLILVIGCVVSIFTIDKFGRKPLLLCSLAICCVSMGGLGTWFFLSEKELIAVVWLPLVLLGFFVIANIAGPATVLHVIIGEIFKFEVRSVFTSIIYMFIWLLTFVTLFVFNPVTQLLGIHGMMWTFAVFNFLGLLFTISYLPETKQNTQEQIKL